MCIGEEGLITCSSLQESHLREPVESNVGGVVLAEQPLAKGRMIQRVMRIGTAPSLDHMVASVGLEDTTHGCHLAHDLDMGQLNCAHRSGEIEIPVARTRCIFPLARPFWRGEE